MSLFVGSIFHHRETQFVLWQCDAGEARCRKQGIERTAHGRQNPTFNAANGVRIATGRPIETSAALATSTRNFALA